VSLLFLAFLGLFLAHGRLGLLGPFVTAWHQLASLGVSFLAAFFFAAGFAAFTAGAFAGSSPCLVKINFGCISLEPQPAASV
tara:strand:- start:1355 stop:1600 length:246 start_codon:yes stop_codon:yes gene_type:complete